jgi:hypothetical protein
MQQAALCKHTAPSYVLHTQQFGAPTEVLPYDVQSGGRMTATYLGVRAVARHAKQDGGKQLPPLPLAAPHFGHPCNRTNKFNRKQQYMDTAHHIQRELLGRQRQRSGSECKHKNMLEMSILQVHTSKTIDVDAAVACSPTPDPLTGTPLLHLLECSNASGCMKYCYVRLGCRERSIA